MLQLFAEMAVEKISFVSDVIPWLIAQFHGIDQKSAYRVVEVSPEMISAVENRLIDAYKCQGLHQKEVLIECTNRGVKILNGDLNKRIAFPPKPGLSDEDMSHYTENYHRVTVGELKELLEKTSFLDDYLGFL
jgi:hypothetical protein